MDLINKISQEVNIKLLLERHENDSTIDVLCYYIKKQHLKLKIDGCRCNICKTKRALVALKRRYNSVKYDLERMNTPWLSLDNYNHLKLEIETMQLKLDGLMN